MKSIRNLAESGSADHEQAGVLTLASPFEAPQSVVKPDDDSIRMDQVRPNKVDCSIIIDVLSTEA